MKNLFKVLLIFSFIPLFAFADSAPNSPPIPRNSPNAPAQQTLFTKLKQLPSFSQGLDNWLNRQRCLSEQRKQHVTVSPHLQKACQVPYTQPKK